MPSFYLNSEQWRHILVSKKLKSLWNMWWDNKTSGQDKDQPSLHLGKEKTLEKQMDKVMFTCQIHVLLQLTSMNHDSNNPRYPDKNCDFFLWSKELADCIKGPFVCPKSERKLNFLALTCDSHELFFSFVLFICCESWGGGLAVHRGFLHAQWHVRF